MPCNHSHAPSYAEVNYGPGNKWTKHLTRDRLNNFEGGHFSDVNISAVLYQHKADGAENVKMTVWSAPGLSKPLFDEAMKQNFKPAKKGDRFGPSWTNHWFKVSVVIPGYWQQYERVQFEFDPGCEAMIFSADGTPLQGITGGWGSERRVEFILSKEARDKGTYDFVIEMSCNGMFGLTNGIGPPDMNRYFTIDSADLVVPNMEAFGLLWDFKTLKEIADVLSGSSTLQNDALTAANAIMNVFESGDPSTIRDARLKAEAIFGAGFAGKGAAVYDEGAKDSRVWGIGHCHIDTAWLWPYRVTQQKVARSWSTQVDLMERYAEHRFTASSAQQYKWLEQLYPKLFEKVKAKILEGKFEAIGGSWVENDCNMPSGEALVRQMLFGQRFFQSRFGIRSQVAWLPDSFGLTGAYPQLMRGAGMKYFFTQKLSWNNINRFPHTTFNWVGIDGTQILAHMTPTDTYTAPASTNDVNRGLSNHKNVESSNTSLLVFGNGDGGGGPLAAMLENLRRIRAATNTHGHLPQVTMGVATNDFYKKLEADSDQGEKLPNWHGELYLEFHRGTYTSHGSIKKGNRHGEILLRDIENLSTLASIYKKGDFTYPKKRLDDAWEKLLLNQFHDVLPGSAIGMVYEDAEVLYAEIQKDGRAMLDEAFKALFPDSKAELKGTNTLEQLIAFNSTPFSRREVVEVPLNSSSQLKSQVVQVSKDGSTGYAIVDCPKEGAGAGFVQPLLLQDAKSLGGVPLPASVYTNGSDHFVLRNSAVQLTISGGRITSLFDVQLQRELIYPGTTGGLVIFDDRPNYWDAWDVEIHHLEKFTPLLFSNISVVAQGPLRAAVQTEIKHGKSTIKVTISLDAVSSTTQPGSLPHFRFDAHVDWRQRHEFLKFELPLNIRNTNATYETAFGYVERPTHKNTTWETAKFEVCGHRYGDLSEYGYGVALLNESKYGYSCWGNILRLSLLRAATEPDAEQDQGEHTFSWAVLMHQGHFLESDVVRAAYLFNSPLYVRSAPEPKPHSLMSHAPFTVHEAPSVILDTIKRGEDDTFSHKSKAPATVVLRLYESMGGHARAKLNIDFGDEDVTVVEAHETNLLEDIEESGRLNFIGTNTNASEITLDFRAFEVKTVKLVLGEKKERKKERDSWVAI